MQDSGIVSAAPEHRVYRVVNGPSLRMGTVGTIGQRHTHTQGLWKLTYTFSVMLATDSSTETSQVTLEVLSAR